MIPKGVENVENIVVVCNSILSALDADDAGTKEIVESVVAAMEGMKTNFFLKTNFAIPPTNACLRSAKELKEALDKKDKSAAADALAKLRTAVEKLLDQGKMEGVIIT